MKKNLYHLFICLFIFLTVAAPAAAQGFVEIMDVRSNATLNYGADQVLESFYEADQVPDSLYAPDQALESFYEADQAPDSLYALDQALESFYEADWVLESFESRVSFRIAGEPGNGVNSNPTPQPDWTQAGLEVVFVGCPDEANQSSGTIQIVIAEGAFSKSGSHRYTADPVDIEALIIGPDGSPRRLNSQLLSLEARLVERPTPGTYVAEVNWSRGVTPPSQNPNPAGAVASSADLPTFSTNKAFLTVRGEESPRDEVTGSTSLACLGSVRGQAY